MGRREGKRLTDGSEVVRVAGWEEFGWLRAGFSRRCGGVSSAFGGKSLNLAWKQEDEDGNVRVNRGRFRRGICGDLDGQDAFSLVTLRQVHSDAIQVVRREGGPFETADGRAVLEGDGLLTDMAGVLLGVQVADCVPVLLADRRRRVVGAFHAGWRGTLARIVAKGILRMREVYGTDSADLVGAVGPSIGPCCYSVGEEVVSSFTEEFGSGLVERRGEEMFLDLWEANRRQMLEAGVAASAITVLGACSACARDEDGGRAYFSHRAEMGAAGRMMGGIGIVAG